MIQTVCVGAQCVITPIIVVAGLAWLGCKKYITKRASEGAKSTRWKERGDGNIHPFKGYCDDDDVENVDISFSRNTVEFTAAFLP